jgi:hypothetical protein
VAVAAALVLEALPTLTATQVQDWLEEQAVDLGKAGKDNTYGAGRLNLQTAVIPGAALQGSTVTLAVAGIPFAPTGTFYLARSGCDDIVPTDVTQVSLSQLTGRIALSGAEIGLWAVVVTDTAPMPLTMAHRFLVASDQRYVPLAMKNASP